MANTNHRRPPLNPDDGFITIELKVSRADWKKAERTGVLSFKSGKPSLRITKLEDAVYEDLYWSGRGSKDCANEFGGNHMRFLRAWRALGLETDVKPADRPTLLRRLQQS